MEHSVQVLENNKKTKKIDFGALQPYIEDIDVTDINCNGKDVWINHVSKGKFVKHQ